MLNSGVAPSFPVHYEMSTNIEVAYISAYDDRESSEYGELAQGFAGAIDALYAQIEGDHLTRVMSIE